MSPAARRSHVALLRGINVGGKNPVAMADLRACCEELGFTDVVTYIQSGNVLFRAGRVAVATLQSRIEAALAARLRCPVGVVVRTREQMRDVVDGAPRGFGSQPAKHRYDVVFLKPPLTAAAALPSVPRREGVDEAHAGDGVLYFSRLVSRASQSRLIRVTALPIYQSMTIRNWNTTTKLARMLDEESP